MNNTKRLDLILARQRRHLMLDALYVGILVAATVIGVSAFAL